MTATNFLQPVPYLSFDGNCAEAMDFYADVFGGTIERTMTFGQSPMAGSFPQEFNDKIMNAQLKLPGGCLMYGGDVPPGMNHSPMSGLMLAINFPDIAEGEKVFNRLAEGGSVTMPYADTFWADKFGMVTDRYGVHWGVNGNLH